MPERAASLEGENSPNLCGRQQPGFFRQQRDIGFELRPGETTLRYRQCQRADRPLPGHSDGHGNADRIRQLVPVAEGEALAARGLDLVGQGTARQALAAERRRSWRGADPFADGRWKERKDGEPRGATLDRCRVEERDSVAK